MYDRLSLISIRVSIFAAMGIGAAACSPDMRNEPGHASSSADASSSSGTSSGTSSGMGGAGGVGGIMMTTSGGGMGGAGGVGGIMMTTSGGGIGGMGGVGGIMMTTSGGGMGGAGGVGGIMMTTSSGGIGGAGGVGGVMTSSSSTGGNSGMACADGVPVLLPNGSDSGYIQCPDGTRHRAKAVACDPTVDLSACNGTEENLNCTSDADCTAAPNGMCKHFNSQGPLFSSCGCVYPCSEDADCGTGKVCICKGLIPNGDFLDQSAWAWSRCASSSTCQTDADCPSGECGITPYKPGCSVTASLACRSPSDTCRVASDCPAPPPFGLPNVCVTTPNSQLGTFNCAMWGGCGIGRPLLVSGEARKAPTKMRQDWADHSNKPDVSSLSLDDRQTLAAAWLEIAALEHASIASFARFSLDLLALGAPPDLLMLAQRAAADEIEHARLAYGLASHYRDSSFGPAPLDLTGVFVATDRRVVLAALIEEACVGETLGAAEALSLASIVEDPVLRSLHARIAADEERHAQLAWRTLQFLLQSADEQTKQFAKSTFERAILDASRDVAPRKKTLRAHGLLSSNEIGAIRRSALRDIVEPCAAALLSPPMVAMA